MQDEPLDFMPPYIPHTPPVPVYLYMSVTINRDNSIPVIVFNKITEKPLIKTIVNK
jgi:hypothetical protein